MASPVSTPDSPHSPATKNRRFASWLLIAFVIAAVDQITKQWIEHQFVYAERLSVLPFFDLTLLYNPGAAFSFLAHEQGWQRWLFSAIALAAIVLILRLIRRHPDQKLFCCSLAFILGGAVGNVLDRFAHGHVIDFLLFYWQDWYFPAFNVADVAITCGAILLILDELIRWRKNRRTSS